MALNDHTRGLLTGLALGVGAAVLARQLGPFRQALRPFAKAAVKSGLSAFERGREQAARLGEKLEDMVAEIKLEQELEVLAREAEAREETAAGEGGA